jgi:hypothetical protein
LIYAVKGSKSSSGIITVNHTDNDNIVVTESELALSKFRYLTFSPMARYRLEKGKMGIFGLLGPRMDILLAYDTDSEYPLIEQNNYLFGLTGALGIEIGFPLISVFSEVQFMPDLSPVSNFGTLFVKNNTFLVDIGIRIPL